jgi:Phage portal protein, lambda family
MQIFPELKGTEAPKPDYGTPWQRRVDEAIGFLSPSLQKKRMEARAEIARLKLNYEGGNSGRERRPIPPIQGSDDPLHQIQQIHLFQRAQDLMRNDGFATSIVEMFQTYCIGDLQYIPKVGTAAENQQYRDFFDEWMTTCDKRGRDSFVEMKKMAYAGFMTFGDHGEMDFHDENGGYQIQSVSGDCIGNPREVIINDRYIRGVIRDENGVPVGVRIFRRTLTDNYIFVRDVPYSIFTHYNPVQTSDEVKAKTPFHAVLNDLQDVREIENAWKMKIKWSSYKTGVFNVPNGGFPEDGLDRLNSREMHGRLSHMSPGQEMIGEPGFTVSMLENNTPSQNELDAVTNILGKICAGVSLPLPWVWVVMGLPGTYTRLISKRAERTFQFGRFGQRWLKRNALVKQKNNAILSGILTGRIPFTKNWNRGQFVFPAHPSMDEGYDSKSDIDEYTRGLRSSAEMAAKRGRWHGDVEEEITIETTEKIQRAVDIADALNARNPALKLTWKDIVNYLGSISPNAKSPGDLVAPEPDPGAKSGIDN